MRRGPFNRSLPAAALCVILSAPAHALTYSFAEFDNGKCQPKCPSVIVATGNIAGNEDEELAWFLRHSGRGRAVGKLVLIHSPGGNMAGGMRLGHFLRRNGASVMVGQASGGAITRQEGLRSGICGSACVFVLAGGVKRIVPAGSVVAVHSAAPVQTEMHDRIGGTVEAIKVNRAEVTHMMGQYYQRMGVNAKLAALSESVPASEIRILTPADLSRLKLAGHRFWRAAPLDLSAETCQRR